jgi:hypothetical protein
MSDDLIDRLVAASKPMKPADSYTAALCADALKEIDRLRSEQRAMLSEINRVSQQDAVITDLRMCLDAADREIVSLQREAKCQSKT